MTRRPTPINDLDTATALTSGDQIPFYSANNGDTRRASVSALATFVAGTLLAPGVFFEQPVAPAASPFTVTVAPIPLSAWTWLILTPTGTMANGTINLAATGVVPVDGQEVLVNSTQIVTALTVAAPTGQNVVGAPTTLAAANAFFRMKYYATTTTWYRVS